MNARQHWPQGVERAPPHFPPPWAAAWGDDHFGVWADLEVTGVVQRLRWIEPGAFMRGDEDRPDTQALHHCAGLWLADSACTQALWQAVMGRNPSGFQEGGDAPLRPVERVSWDDAQGFLAALAAQTPGAVPALPDECEWEYACRAGTTGPFSFGDDITTEQVNYDGNSPYHGHSKGLYRQATVPVRSLPANSWGLYEMHGNVWEWCQDAVELSEAEGSGKRVVPRRALRGGSWFDGAWYARSAFRNSDGPVGRNYFVGFRFALRSASPSQALTPADLGFPGVGRPGAR